MLAPANVDVDRSPGEPWDDVWERSGHLLVMPPSSAGFDGTLRGLRGVVAAGSGDATAVLVATGATAEPAAKPPLGGRSVSRDRRVAFILVETVQGSNARRCADRSGIREPGR